MNSVSYNATCRHCNEYIHAALRHTFRYFVWIHDHNGKAKCGVLWFRANPKKENDIHG